MDHLLWCNIRAIVCGDKSDLEERATGLSSRPIRLDFEISTACEAAPGARLPEYNPLE